jgi:hypothetical protein
MGYLIGHIRRFLHCLWWSFTFKDHRMVSMYIPPNSTFLECTCGKRFYSYGDEKLRLELLDHVKRNTP